MVAPREEPRRGKSGVQDLKLRRLNENNERLRAELARRRLRVSEASLSLIAHCRETRDPMLPSVWGEAKKGEDPYAPPDTGCCLIM